VKASAPGNIFFAGEHAVVYGKPAIIAAVERRTYCTASKRQDDKIIIESREFGKAFAFLKNTAVKQRTGKQELFVLFDLIESLAKKHEIKKGLKLKIESEVPVESGLSSSTAVLSASLCSLDGLLELGIKKEEYFEYLYPMQVKIHGGKASGSEIISSALGGYNRIQKIEKEGKTMLDWRNLGQQSLSVVIGNTKVRAPTALAVGMHIPSLMKRFPGMVENEFEKIAAICNEIEEALKKHDEALLGALLNKNQAILSKLGLSHPKLDDCINEALKAGALGAKLSGGGWGGVMFALVRKGDEQKVAKAIESTGAETIITKIGCNGAKLCE